VRYFVDPFGCAKNQVDAENMMAALDSAGWSAADAADADVIIVNSCGFIESAKQESINAVLLWRRQYPEKKILLAGCLSQRYANDLAESLPEVDAFFGVEDVAGITEKINSVLENHPPFPIPHSPFPTSSRPLLSLPGSAYVKISEGCNNCCSFCAIPLIRGPLHCRSVVDIVEECRGLLARGIRELCVIGQDIGSYRSDGCGLPELLAAIAELPGDFWLRLLYMHPDHFPLAVLDLMEKDSRVLPYFDIPFQHASPTILAAMNRKGSAESYIALADTIRERLPRAVIRSTFLVGFSGETDADFAALLDFQHKLRPDWLGCFAYSREEDTPAYSMKGQVPKKTAAARKREIEDRQIVISEQNADRFVGQNLDVLVEERFGSGDDADSGGADNGDLWLGRLYCHAPEVDGAAVIVCEGDVADSIVAGQVLPCRVIARRGIDLEVRLKD
jgi:ribosomal protein S12 methylthiotransferase